MATVNLVQAAHEAAVKAGINPTIFARQINQESGFQPDAASGAGAKGIAQIVPEDHPDAPPASDPVGQLNWAAQYMAGLVNKYGNYASALSVYNSGQPFTYQDPSFAKGQTYNYVKNILGGTTVPTGGTVPVPATPTAKVAPAAKASTPGVSQSLLTALLKGSNLLKVPAMPVQPVATLPQITLPTTTAPTLTALPTAASVTLPSFVPPAPVVDPTSGLPVTSASASVPNLAGLTSALSAAVKPAVFK